MKQRFRLYRRKGGIFYLHDSHSGKQTSLGTRERSEAVEMFSPVASAPAGASESATGAQLPDRSRPDGCQAHLAGCHERVPEALRRAPTVAWAAGDSGQMRER